jgi:predicted kinase
MLTIIRGIPGSGKSTLAKKVVSLEPKTIHVEADMYFVGSDGKYAFDPEGLRAAHEWCQNAVRICLNHRMHCVVSNTFVRNWEMDPYIKMAMAVKSKITVYECKNIFSSIHNVPFDKVKIMSERWEEVVVPDYPHFDVIEYVARD